MFIGNRVKHGGKLGTVTSIFLNSDDQRIYVTADMDSGEPVTDLGSTFKRLYFTARS